MSGKDRARESGERPQFMLGSNSLNRHPTQIILQIRLLQPLKKTEMQHVVLNLKQ